MRENFKYGLKKGYVVELIWLKYCGTGGKLARKRRKQTLTYVNFTSAYSTRRKK